MAALFKLQVGMTSVLEHRSFQQLLVMEITEQTCPFLCNCHFLFVLSPFLLFVVFPIPSAYVHVLFGVF